MSRFQRVILRFCRNPHHSNVLANAAYLAFGREKKRDRLIRRAGLHLLTTHCWPDLYCHYFGRFRLRGPEDSLPGYENNGLVLDQMLYWIWTPRTKAGELWLLTSMPDFAAFWPPSVAASDPTEQSTAGAGSKTSSGRFRRTWASGARGTDTASSTSSTGTCGTKPR